MFSTLSAKMFASLTADRRENLRRRIALREQVTATKAAPARRLLAGGYLLMQGYQQPITGAIRSDMERAARAHDRAIRVLGRFHDLQEAAAHNALHVA